MRVLLNYADAPFQLCQKLNSQTALSLGGFDRVVSCGPGDLDRRFVRAHRQIFRHHRGGGYWLWKPYLIHRTLCQLAEGDLLFYCDSGSHFISSAEPLLELLQGERQVVVFELELIEKHWTKRDAFVLLDCDNTTFAESRQRLGGFQIWKKCLATVALAKEYLDMCQDPRLLTDLENQMGKPDYEGFVEHRHDQSVLSLLSKKHGIEAFRDPSQWGNGCMAAYPNSPYGQVLELTRARQSENPVWGALRRWLFLARAATEGLPGQRPPRHCFDPSPTQKA